MTRNITTDVVNKLLRELAVGTYNLKTIKEIQKFSTHSFWVNTCIKLLGQRVSKLKALIRLSGVQQAAAA